MANSTAELTNDRLSVMILEPAAACNREGETELAGVHNAGRTPSCGGQLPTNALMRSSGTRWLRKGPQDSTEEPTQDDPADEGHDGHQGDHHADTHAPAFRVRAPM